jgi:hypothetical protein
MERRSRVTSQGYPAWTMGIRWGQGGQGHFPRCQALGRSSMRVVS